MKKRILGIAAIIAAIAFAGFACGGGGGGGGTTYNIGDTGPGGGIIFYVDEAGFTMTDTGKTAHYLEAAPADMPGTFVWAMPGYYDVIIPGTLTAIGTGKNNTGIILAALGGDSEAAFACDGSIVGGKTDWFLPSKDELNELYKNKDIVGLVSDWYWSSSQYNAQYYVWRQNGDTGEQVTNSASNNPFKVRAIRAF